MCDTSGNDLGYSYYLTCISGSYIVSQSCLLYLSVATSLKLRANNLLINPRLGSVFFSIEINAGGNREKHVKVSFKLFYSVDFMKRSKRIIKTYTIIYLFLCTGGLNF